jgi:hypothetical protein
LKLNTDDGILRHGSRVENHLGIGRNGFYLSTSTQGTAVYGAGVYSSKDKNIADGYGDIIELKVREDQNLRIIDWSSVENHPAINRLKTQYHGSDFFLYLADKCDVDIVQNGHTLILNAGALEELSPLQLLRQQIKKHVSLLEEESKVKLPKLASNEHYSVDQLKSLFEGRVSPTQQTIPPLAKLYNIPVPQAQEPKPTKESSMVEIVATLAFSGNHDTRINLVRALLQFATESPDNLRILKEAHQENERNFFKTVGYALTAFIGQSVLGDPDLFDDFVKLIQMLDVPVDFYKKLAKFTRCVLDQETRIQAARLFLRLDPSLSHAKDINPGIDDEKFKEHLRTYLESTDLQKQYSLGQYLKTTQSEQPFLFRLQQFFSQYRY